MTKCPICFGIGWVCETHPLRAWSETLGCMCSEGMPCKCNTVEDPDIRAVMVDESEITWYYACLEGASRFLLNGSSVWSCRLPTAEGHQDPDQHWFGSRPEHFMGKLRHSFGLFDDGRHFGDRHQ